MAHPRQRKKIKNPNKKVTRRVANKYYKKMPHITDPTLKKAWNKRLSMKQNFAQFGLALDVNTDIKNYNQPLAGEAVIERLPEGDMIIDVVREPKKIVASTPILEEWEKKASSITKRQRHLSRNEKKLKEILVATYGDDVEKMARDHKLNPYQRTATQLKHLIAK
jgi:nucleolar protein 16